MGPSRSSRRSTCSSTWTFPPGRTSVAQEGPSAPGPSAPRDPGRGSRALGNRGVLVSSASTVLFFAIIAVVVVLAPGSGVVAERFFSPQHLWQSLVGSEGNPSVLGAFLLNVQIFMVSEVFILILALVIAVVRGIPGPVFFPFRLVAVAYTDLLRGVPLILVLYMIGFGVPGLDLGFISYLPDVAYGVISLVLVYSAYVAEVYRAGIESVHESQNAAARSLGLTRWQSLRFVVLPQAIRRVIPPLLNDFIGLQKDTALVSVLGSIEAARAAQIYGASEFNYASYVVAALLFVLITIPLARFTDRLIARDKRRREAEPWHERTSGPAPGKRLQVLRREQSSERDRPYGRAARGGMPDRGLRLGQVHAAQVRKPGRADRFWPGRCGGRRAHRRRCRHEPDPPGHRHRLPVIQPLSTHDGPAQHHPRPAGGIGDGPRRGREECPRPTGTFRAPGQARRVP